MGQKEDVRKFGCTDNQQFNNVNATVKFIRMINDMFDIMNSTNSENATGFKRAISNATVIEMFERLKEVMEYIEKLKVEGETKSIFHSSVFGLLWRTWRVY